MSNIDTKIYVFGCATSYDQAEITRNVNHPGVETKVVLIPCSGKLDILYLTKAFETGADGVVVMICKEGMPLPGRKHAGQKTGGGGGKGAGGDRAWHRPHRRYSDER